MLKRTANPTWQPATAALIVGGNADAVHSVIKKQDSLKVRAQKRLVAREFWAGGCGVRIEKHNACIMSYRAPVPSPLCARRSGGALLFLRIRAVGRGKSNQKLLMTGFIREMRGGTLNEFRGIASSLGMVTESEEVRGQIKDSR